MHLCGYDFLWLAQYNPDWVRQDHLSANKTHVFLACFLHYNVSMAQTMRFLGAYRNMAMIMDTL
jgi:hypothetical protein